MSPEALDALACFVNKYSDIYDLGLAFGGINGTAVTNVEGDGYWNQRYMGAYILLGFETNHSCSLSIAYDDRAQCTLPC